jgi:hypothetical protein
MIGSDLESAGLESRAASGAASASSDDAAAVRAVIEASTSRCRSSQEGAAPASSESATRIRVRSASACGRRARRGSGYDGVYLPVRGSCR